MNHKYILLLLACTAGAAQAQRVNKSQTPSWARFEHATTVHDDVRPHGDPQARDAGDIVFTEDFANGLAGNNGFGAWTTSEADGEIWKFNLTPPYGAYTGQGGSELITSTTADNGSMLFNSDSANTDWSDTTIVPAPANWDGALESPILDLSATPSVLLEFEMAARWCCDEAPWYVQVSADGGSSWPTSFRVLGGQAVNVGTNTVTVTINITCGIDVGDASQVKFRFFHDGTTSGTSAYYWQLDDVKLIVPLDYDLILEEAAQTDWVFETSTNYDSLNYTVLPFSQLRPLPLNMTLSNNGSFAQPGTSLNFKVMEGTNTVLDQNQAIDLGACPEQVFVSPEFTPPAVVGTYDVTYTATSSVGDVTTDDNTAESSFKVSEFIYARDGGAVAGYFENTDQLEYEFCNAFYIANEVELYAIDVAIRSGGSPSPIGTPILGKLKDGTDFDIEIAETMEHTIASNELNGTGGTKFISLIFSEPQILEAGLDYFVCLKHFGGAEVRTALSGFSEDRSSFINYDPPADDPDAGMVWFYTNDMPMVRMNFNSTVGIEEGDRQNGIGMGQNFPNPTDGVTYIPYDLKEAANVTFEVHDLSGKLVRAQGLGKRSVGAHRLEFNASELNEGVYFYSLIVDGTRLTKRMTVIH